MSILVASDPEVFLKNKNGHHVVATNLIGGDKYNPRRTKNGWVQEDGAAAEFNVYPSQTEEEFIANHLLVLSDLEEIIKVHELELDIVSSVVFDEEILMQHPQLMMAGCSPDYNAWTFEQNIPPDYNSGLRAAGGHVHISFSEAGNSMIERSNMIKALDFILGVPSVLIDSDVQRRTLYGKAGCFRPKFIEEKDPYDGVEYRTLSNFWLKSPDLMAWVFRGVHKAHSIRNEINFDEMENDIRNIINNGLKEQAYNFCKINGIEVI